MTRARRTGTWAAAAGLLLSGALAGTARAAEGPTAAGEDNWGSGALCEKCRGKAFIANVGECQACGRGTSSGAFMFCQACARKRSQCQACGAPLAGAKPKPPAETKAPPAATPTPATPAASGAAPAATGAVATGVVEPDRGGGKEPTPTPTPPAPTDAAAAAVHRYLAEIARKSPDLFPIVKGVLREGAKEKKDPALTAALPKWRFFSLRFMQYPVGFPVPEPLAANNLFAVPETADKKGAVACGPVTHIRTPEELRAFGTASLVAKAPDATDRKARDSALRASAHGYALLRAELAQDGFFRFEVKPETFRIEDLPTGLVRCKVSASLRVAPGGGNGGSIDLALTFVGEAGGFRLEKVEETVNLKEGMRPICQSLKLCDPDAAVRAAAERDLLVMGRNCLPYLRAKAGETEGEISARIRRLLGRIEAGEGNLAVEGGQPEAN